ncbi:2,4-dienoyl-CoA reductase-like NADH-dependent reductase (Old Yellow Enzyme family) [Planomicrobium stackebrandtii]|uniref:2,4-dienoyl-CoA reductase-like NADH-dependent reductase (Old Yellow Enzyme family) n=1 Tax=Planomicrobium stackebrandtii TaxID=253160 RepID=A0ABU0GTI2_9BACL|nr:NADH-dependent flavin oxidoreductase [Planomicrobium stackebrandtii]MDQ0428667.1 2,4-dienoyl-CoA reductase-like NADH-dependent reductase (Old Yellow Enzyme family) [Planomicrobium stackebrandtii]
MTITTQSIFEPFSFTSGLTLKNRVLMAPMTTSSSDQNGDVTEQELVYYKRRSQSGLGAVITACAHVEPLGVGFLNPFGADSDERIDSLARLAASIQDGGAKAILQLYHAGRMSNKELLKGEQPVSASAVPAPRPNAATPREMAPEEIEATIAAFGEATRRAIEAGFDGVEIHGANTYLVQQFFSPHSNIRTDKWGGDVTARMAFPLAVIRSIQEAVAEHANKPFVVGYRISPEEREEPGITMDDTLAFLTAIADQGIDYIHISVGKFFGGSIRSEDSRSRVEMIQEHIGKRVPVIGVGGLQTLEQVKRALEITPLVSLGHALIMDPDWLAKVKGSRDEEIFQAIHLSKKEQLDIPEDLWNMVTNAPGWFRVEE